MGSKKLPPDRPAPDAGNLSLPCLSLDLEVGRDDGLIHAFGAVRGDSGRSIRHSGGNLQAALAELDRFAEGASFLLGHNLIAFDLPHIKAVAPDLRLLRLPALDTLLLSPLAFPRNPYHRLVKHYQDGSIRRRRRNDPELDARLALEILSDQHRALASAEPDLLCAWHWLCVRQPDGADRALDGFFSGLRGRRRPEDGEAQAAIGRLLQGKACISQSGSLIERAGSLGWPLAYALAWLSVAGGNSVMPPWVRHQFPDAGRIVRRLRDRPCRDRACSWCRQQHDAVRQLKRWFGFDGFRPEPACRDGRPMQQAIAEAAMAGRNAFGILPTGTGKSICYQVPALSRYYRTGALTVVISPLVALMADQIAGLEKSGIDCCETVNSLQSLPERSRALERIRLGDAAILLISPEQLRSLSLRRAIAQREIGAWVMDEAHCLSRWGQDFRPDYRYVGRFIRQRAGKEDPPPVLCLTATAKPDVIDDIVEHFRERLGIRLEVFNGGAERSNLVFEVMPTTEGKKFSDIHKVLDSFLPKRQPGGAIVYCATRRQSAEVAEFLQGRKIAAESFHAGLSPEVKKDVQQRFVAGDLRVIAATNAFGMGIDKPDVRLVIHADIPGSLESYLQEAGRAGRDREAARCVLLYAADDIERQFGMSARGRLSRGEIHGILRALRNLDRRKRLGGQIVASPGEILGEDYDQAFERDSTTDDTRVRTALSWLEETQLLRREENVVKIFPSSLRVSSLEEAGRRLDRARVTGPYRESLLCIARALIGAKPDEGISTDELMGAAGLGADAIRSALHDLERIGISSDDTPLTAFVHAGIARSSRRRFEQAEEIEGALIAYMRGNSPGQGKGDTASIHLRVAAQALRDRGIADPLPERLWRIIRSISQDGRSGAGGSVGSLTARKSDVETVRITLNREWGELEDAAGLRRAAAARLLDHMLASLPPGQRGTDLLAETTFGRLMQALESDLSLKGRVRDISKLHDRALLWLHDQEVLRLNRGLTVFRPAMTIRLERRERRRGFAGADFTPLALHYKGQVMQIHIMREFAERGCESIGEALRMVMDYFSLREDEFLARWLPGREREIGRQTTPESWRSIVESLGNPVQQRIVSDARRKQRNALVLAGPGSGKTRVLVHRIAWLIRVRRESAAGILALAYNRHAAVDIRRRLTELIGSDARAVTVLTCHALAMRIAGASFASRVDQPDDRAFGEILGAATALLRGEELLPEEADERRARIMAGFGWILVDEYQDINREQYELISALAGRTLEDDSSRLTIFAVGDDDQNIYSFNGASVEFIRRFEKDYGPRPTYLTANYRSTGNIVAAANAVIAPARQRMKAEHPIHVDRARADDAAGGEWEGLDPVGRGRVQILPAGSDQLQQAAAVIAELGRLAALSPHWDWSRCAVIGRQWECLIPVQELCQAEGIPVQMANEEIPGFWRLRQTQALVQWLRTAGAIDSDSLLGWLEDQPADTWRDLLIQAAEEHGLEAGTAEVPVDHFIEWLAEWGRDLRRRQQGLLLLTAHRAKGLEFDHVVVLDGRWNRVGRGEDPDAARRLYYVAMTRARQTLTLACLEGCRSFCRELAEHPAALRRQAVQIPPPARSAGSRRLRASLKQVDLSFAGRHHAGNPVHAAIAALAVGDPLQVQQGKSGSWELLDADGRTVGRLARAFELPAGMRCRSAEVFAVIRRRCGDSEAQYRDAIKCDEWEVIVPELAFDPDR